MIMFALFLCYPVLFIIKVVKIEKSCNLIITKNNNNVEGNKEISIIGITYNEKIRKRNKVFRNSNDFLLRQNK